MKKKGRGGEPMVCVCVCVCVGGCTCGGEEGGPVRPSQYKGRGLTAGLKKIKFRPGPAS